MKEIFTKFINLFLEDKIPEEQNPIAENQYFMQCPDCRGFGLEDVFSKCTKCDGTGVVRKTYQEYVESLPPVDKN
jgi:DnaJ-class molecular chaperone